MTYVFVAENLYSGDRKIFKEETFADMWIKVELINMHQLYCINKCNFIKECLCTISDGSEECSFHYEQRTIPSHKLDTCRFKDKVLITKEIVH